MGSTATFDDHGRAPDEGDRAGSLSRRRLLTYLVKAPVLSVGIGVVGNVLGGVVGDALDDAVLAAGDVDASPGVPDLVDLSDALTAAALPTTPLMSLSAASASPARS